MTACDRYRFDLASSVLRGLDPDEHAAVEAHLAGCHRCREEHAELASGPPLLDLVRDAPPRAPAHLRDRVVAEAVRRRARRRWLATAAAAVLMAAVLGGAVAWRILPPAPPALAVPLDTAVPFEASGWATFDERGRRIAVSLALEGLAVLDEPAVYEAWLSTADGRVRSIGQLAPSPDGSAVVTLSASGSLDAYRYIWVTAEPDARDPAHDGPTVLRAPVPPSRGG